MSAADFAPSKSSSDQPARTHHHGHLCVVMGVSACGKSTVGEAIVQKLSERWPESTVRFVDADVYHPQPNIQKMAAGIPLNDDDRAGWLTVLAHLGREAVNKGETCILACSALKRAYRLILFGHAVNMEEAMKLDAAAVERERQTGEECAAASWTGHALPPTSHFLVFLRGSKELMTKRSLARHGHYAKANLLDSQFATLEPPTPLECEAIGVNLKVIDLDKEAGVEKEAEEVANWIAKL